MERKSFNKFKKWGVILGTTCVSFIVVCSLIYYSYIWYINQKVLIINEVNVSTYLFFIGAILMSVLINIGLTIYYSQSLKKVEKLMVENCLLSELVLKQSFKNKDEILEAIEKVGVPVD